MVVLGWLLGATPLRVAVMQLLLSEGRGVFHAHLCE